MFGFLFFKNFNKRLLLKGKKDIEPNEVFLDQLTQKKKDRTSEQKVECPVSSNVFRLFLLFCFLLLFTLFGRAFQLQVIQSEELSASAERNKFISQSLAADRGVIYDQKGKQLVFNRPSFDLVIDKGLQEKTVKTLSQILEISVEEIEEKIKESRKEDVSLIRGLEHKKLVLLKTKLDELPGVEIKDNSAREYIDSKVFSHILGYTGQVGPEEMEKEPGAYSGLDYVGKAGVEKFYEEFLRKKSGVLKIEREASGNVISESVEKDPEPGKSLVLWANYGLQKKAYDSLERKLEEIGSEKGVIVALDPNSGGVLSMVSIPGYDNNLFSRESGGEALKEILSDKKNPLFNRAVSGRYPTGSTIKPFVAAAALEEELVAPADSINCQGAITIPHRYDPEIVYEYKDWSVHGLTDLKKAIAESCNVYFYTIGGGYGDQEGLGPSRIKHYLELFGWGEESGIDLPSEYSGFIPSPEWKKKEKRENWWDGDTYNLSIGQGDILIPPIQVAAAFAAIANGGTLYEPRIGKQVIDSQGSVIEEIKPSVVRKNFVSSGNIEAVREGMKRAVTGLGAPQASSILLNSLPITSAAKTGTAQTRFEDRYHNWVTVFAPYENPEIVLTVMVEEVEGVRSATLPVAKEILNWYFSEKNHEKTHN